MKDISWRQGIGFLNQNFCHTRRSRSKGKNKINYNDEKNSKI